MTTVAMVLSLAAVQTGKPRQVDLTMKVVRKRPRARLECYVVFRTTCPSVSYRVSKSKEKCLDITQKTFPFQYTLTKFFI